MKVTVKKLSELKPLEKNVRRHNEKQITEYMRSLDKFLQIRPMVVDEAGVILVGNGMYEAMRRLGWETADCYVVTGLTEAEKMKLMLSDNRVYELGMTDMDAFEAIIADLNGDFDIPGWEDDLLETLSASMADATEMVQGYGVFDPKEIENMRDKERDAVEIHAAPPERPPTTPAAPVPDVAASADRTEWEPPTAPVRTDVARTVVCPHCGQSFVLSMGGA